MNILMVLADHGYPDDLRIKKESKSLIHNNHSVFLITNLLPQQKKTELVDGMVIFRHRFKFVKPVLDFFYHFFFSRHLPFFLILKYYRELKIQCIHVHDLPSAFSCIIVGKLLKIPVIVDLHENYPDLIRSSGASKHGFKYLGNLIKVYIYTIEERFCCKHAQHLISVVEEQKSRLIHLGGTNEKIFVVSNTIDLDEMKSIKSIPTMNKHQEKIVISYVGGLSDHRGIMTFLKSLPIVFSHLNDVLVYIVGDGSRRHNLQEYVKQQSLEKFVTFTGQVSFTDAMGYIQKSTLGIIPYDASTQTQNAMPHKIFQYMYYGKPVIVSDVKGLKRIVDTTHCGYLFHAGDNNDLSKVIIKIASNRQDLLERGNSGRIAVIQKYNWARDGRILCDLYSKIPTKLY
jgi:glycosyltransferase involved in cell wall biosynthesis